MIIELDQLKKPAASGLLFSLRTILAQTLVKISSPKPKIYFSVYLYLRGENKDYIKILAMSLHISEPMNEKLSGDGLTTLEGRLAAGLGM